MASSRSKYDLFFSKSMEEPAIAKAFFTQYLPALIKAELDVATLRRVDRTNTDEKLKQRHRDIIYKGALSDQNTLFACVEHQSQEDLSMPVRFLTYNAAVLGPYLKAYKKLPLIINLLFYTGPRSPYPYPSTLQGYYERPQWGSQELSLRFHVIDNAQFSDEALLTHGCCAPMELLLKYSRGTNFELAPAAYRSVFQTCIATVGNDYLLAMLTYAAELSDEQVGEKLFKFIEEVLIDKKDIIMTYGQRLQQQGMQQGRNEGIQQGRNEGIQQGRNEGIQQGMQQGIATRNLEIARSMLSDGEPLTRIMKWTGLSEETLKKLELG